MWLKLFGSAPQQPQVMQVDSAPADAGGAQWTDAHEGGAQWTDAGGQWMETTYGLIVQSMALLYRGQHKIYC